MINVLGIPKVKMYKDVMMLAYLRRGADDWNKSLRFEAARDGTFNKRTLEILGSYEYLAARIGREVTTPWKRRS